MKYLTAYTSTQTDNVRVTKEAMRADRVQLSALQIPDTGAHPSLQYPRLIATALKKSDKVMWIDPGTAFAGNPDLMPTYEGFDVVGLTPDRLHPKCFNPTVSTYSSNEETIKFLTDWADECDKAQDSTWIDVLQQQFLFNDDYLRRGLNIAILPTLYVKSFIKLKTSARQDLSATSAAMRGLESPTVLSWYESMSPSGEIHASQQKFQLEREGLNSVQVKRPETLTSLFKFLHMLHVNSETGIYVIPPRSCFNAAPHFIFDTHADVVLFDDTGTLGDANHVFYAKTDETEKMLKHLADTGTCPMFVDDLRKDYGYAEILEVGIPKRIRNIVYKEM